MQLSASLSPAERALLERWLDELYLWNPRVNLTAVPRELAWGRHVEESMGLLEAAAPAPRSRLVDVGSGGGAPAIPISVLRPDLRLLLIEADARKAAFLVHVAGMLRLGAVAVARRRAEDVGRDPELRERFDLATSRATAAPGTLCELALPLLRVGGLLTALVGDAEAAVLQAEVAARQCGGGVPRAARDGILVVTKERPTPDRFPRRSGVPARRPLG
ncbi:MAG: 16S rRNA (guanine(527)-N(7))-methyltransferase RsmG [Chloroflexi bacterium]|nr:MAG: 16S rRNA (guanine(527)-N(7))-methyltransferase RsmG [Chloroflexota bacterium]